ncbi:polyketide cyclase [Natronospirillum operosum]|uniref:Polyketide cyclase n=1 Tax=Natronospirillum operosum TaxID=2759953 RepID=A0A4Z0WBT4_9GAMM|nr:SRPBCC family protein [Natronospirillum operosum]TGG95612.1 polyketide cyclase [Natronospirillum operosum]
MSAKLPFTPNPETDLVLERTVDVPPEWVWAAWTNPEHLKHWFCPRPWSVAECKIDLRPGGVFRTVMKSPQGELMPAGDGCILALEENRRLVWTSAMEPDFRPVESGEDAFLFTAHILIEPDGAGTRYVAIAMHPDEKGRQKHEQMGFHEGWGTALDQLVEYMQSRAS